MRDPADAPDPETAARWARHAALVARQQEEKRLREIAREAEQKGAIPGLERYGKKASKRPLSSKGHPVEPHQNQKRKKKYS